MKSPKIGTWSTAVAIVLVCIGSYVGSIAQGTQAIDGTLDLEPHVELEPFLSGLTMPVFLTNARDGSNRLFIVEQPGRIKVLPPGSTTPTIFLDIVQRVDCCGEQGLLGLTFHPDFASNRRFFVDYTRRSDGATVIAEYRVSASNPNVADQAETVLLTIPQPFANHNGGMIEFGPDGFLYIATGDGGSGNDPGNRAQNVNELLGKFLRIDIDNPNGSIPYSSPPTNPFFGGTPGRDEIFAVGLRNPWRFSFDRATGRLFVGDVGQNEIEEVNIIDIGGNYGWRVFEGTRCTNIDPQLCNAANFIQPITEYSHSGGRCSITGGYVYRGPLRSLPSGSYVFGDFCTGEIFLFNGGQQSLLLDTNLNISSFGEDEEGELYVVGLGGTIQRIVDPQEIPPILPTIDSAIVRKRKNGKVLNPITVRSNAKKFEVVVSGGGFVEGTVVLANGRELKTASGSDPAVELIARLRQSTLLEAGPLTIEAVAPGGARSNAIILEVLSSGQ